MKTFRQIQEDCFPDLLDKEIKSDGVEIIRFYDYPTQRCVIKMNNGQEQEVKVKIISENPLKVILKDIWQTLTSHSEYPTTQAKKRLKRPFARLRTFTIQTKEGMREKFKEINAAYQALAGRGGPATETATKAREEEWHSNTYPFVKTDIYAARAHAKEILFKMMQQQQKHQNFRVFFEGDFPFHGSDGVA